ncbi:hypothetical protein [Streptomyces sp. NPDC004014]
MPSRLWTTSSTAREIANSSGTAVRFHPVTQTPSAVPQIRSLRRTVQER